MQTNQVPLAGPKAHSIPASILQRELAAAADACSLAHNVQRAWKAVCLMIKSLELHPLSQRLPAGVSGGLPVDKDTMTTKNMKITQSGELSTASAQPPTSCQPEVWPTPEPNEWQGVQLVALRAFTILGWAVSTVSVNHTSVQDTNILVQRLCQVLQHLVAGHLPDLDLDMQTLFGVGLQPVLDAQLGGHAESEGLAAMMLLRLAADSRLALQGQLRAHQICLMFGESSQPIVVFDTS